MKKKSITIIGPTASGKSDVAITLSKRFGGEVISADSRQIYRNLDIGTGKEPGKLETIKYLQNGDIKILKKSNLGSTLGWTLADAKKGITKAYIIDEIPHYMIDIVHPNTVYNVAKFVKKAKNIRKNIWNRNKLPIVAGGTMFWAQALLEDTVFPNVKPNNKLRKTLSQKNTQDLFKHLKKLDPIYAKKVDPNNPVRLIRAIEIASELGYVPKPSKVTIDTQQHLIIAIMHPHKVLYDRIEKRMDKWFDIGIFEEIEYAHKQLGVPWTRLGSFGLEYKWCTKHVRGEIDFDTMRTNTIRDLKKYARRQETWIKRWANQGAKIHHITQEKEARKLCEKFLKT